MTGIARRVDPGDPEYENEYYRRFDKASKGGQPLPDGVVSLNNLNNLYFAAFSSHFPHGGHAEVLVAEDEAGNALKLAIRPVPAKTKDSYSILSGGYKERTSITLAALVRKYEITPAQYKAYWDTEHKMLIVRVAEEKP